ncbi:SipW-dependent-type signal peptide-containing protein [Microbacterium soli]|uniref:SipW-cognate class signal peptide n=1 Tax=Microbacterium soli TaxID=446075 RepID=A0ABP7NG65_9MICO
MNRTIVASAASASLRRRRISAVLAGGLVLGVGAAVTLAAWNDSEWATSTFTAGSFDLEGSTDGVNFTDHAAEDDAAGLGFAVDADDIVPGQTLYALYSIRLIGTADGVLTVEPPTISGDNAANLTAATRLIDGTTCDASTFDDGTATPPATIAASEDGSTGQLDFCLQVTAGPDLTQEESGVVTWQWTVESQ